ncbi:hypothetical protein ACFLZP_00630 [Patescibacteria group bacterium]
MNNPPEFTYYVAPKSESAEEENTGINPSEPSKKEIFLSWLRQVSQKVLSILLITFGFYHILISVILIFFIYPRQLGSPQSVSLYSQKSLVEKAIVLYLTTIVDGFFGIALLAKPKDEIKIFHLLAGLGILLFSVIFVSRSVFTQPQKIFLDYLFKKR